MKYRLIALLILASYGIGQYQHIQPLNLFKSLTGGSGYGGGSYRGSYHK